jgi:hypothetical protein
MFSSEDIASSIFLVTVYFSTSDGDAPTVAIEMTFVSNLGSTHNLIGWG